MTQNYENNGCLYFNVLGKNVGFEGKHITICMHMEKTDLKFQGEGG